MKTNTATEIFKSFCRSDVYRRSAMTLCLVLCTFGLGLPANGGTPTIITFDAPGAGTAAGQGTTAFGINPSGTITGFTRDTNFARHGFVRANDGTITVFDAPGAG